MDTFFWNQMAELSFVIRRECADNDALEHMRHHYTTDYSDVEYMSIKHIIPWVLGPNGDSFDRILIQVPPTCKVIYASIRRSLPSQLWFGHKIVPSPSPPLSHVIPAADFSAATSVISACSTSFSNSLSWTTQRRPSTPVQSQPSCSNSGSSSDSEHGSISDSGTDLSLINSTECYVGNLVAIMCELGRVDYPCSDSDGIEDIEYIRVYTINALSINIVVCILDLQILAAIPYAKLLGNAICRTAMSAARQLGSTRYPSGPVYQIVGFGHFGRFGLQISDPVRIPCAQIRGFELDEVIGSSASTRQRCQRVNVSNGVLECNCKPTSNTPRRLGHNLNASREWPTPVAVGRDNCSRSRYRRSCTASGSTAPIARGKQYACRFPPVSYIIALPSRALTVPPRQISPCMRISVPFRDSTDNVAGQPPALERRKRCRPSCALLVAVPVHHCIRTLSKRTDPPTASPPLYAAASQNMSARFAARWPWLSSARAPAAKTRIPWERVDSSTVSLVVGGVHGRGYGGL
ncbi:hypothetical protein B0H15DRAFT_807100 [Mycena belliarum]|uniref:Uncharacterized protein n=1 Tax=Mycena belliarum TaxID=1033014 RepID=A0AAD6TLV6_9AGAR|nr:hypothetical protein B0H15DRAFT_807100 [Mycena belliae]